MSRERRERILRGAKSLAKTELENAIHLSERMWRRLALMPDARATVRLGTHILSEATKNLRSLRHMREEECEFEAREREEEAKP